MGIALVIIHSNRTFPITKTIQRFLGVPPVSELETPSYTKLGAADKKNSGMTGQLDHRDGMDHRDLYGFLMATSGATLLHSPDTQERHPGFEWIDSFFGNLYRTDQNENKQTQLRCIYIYPETPNSRFQDFSKGGKYSPKST